MFVILAIIVTLIGAAAMYSHYEMEVPARHAALGAAIAVISVIILIGNLL